MRLSWIALKNVQQHPARMLLLTMLIALVVGIVTTLMLVTRAAEADIAHQTDEYGANITVVPRTEQLPLVYGGVRVGDITYETTPLTMNDVALVRTIPENANINRVAPKLLEVTEIDGVRLMAVGVVWSEELPLKTWWNIQGSEPQGADQVLLGARAAERLSLTEGESFRLQDRTFAVAGVIESTGSQEDDLLFMDLAAAQSLWGREGEVSFVEVSAWCSSCPIETIGSQISNLLPGARVTPLRASMESRELLVGQFRLFSYVLSAFMVVAGALVVLTSTLSRVRERKVEIGAFRALGYRRKHVLEVVVLENLVVGAAAAALGVALAWLVSGPVARLIAGVARPASPDPLLLAGAVIIAVLVILLATVYPAWQASRLSPLAALRRV